MDADLSSDANDYAYTDHNDVKNVDDDIHDSCDGE